MSTICPWWSLYDARLIKVNVYMLRTLLQQDLWSININYTFYDSPAGNHLLPRLL